MTPPATRSDPLNRLSTPEQLDELMQVTSPRGWIALAGFALLISVAAIWGLVGTVTTTVAGKGVLMRGSSIKTESSPCDGEVVSILPASGAKLDQGDPLVVLKPAQGEPVTVYSPFSCRILSRHTRSGEALKKNDPLLTVECLSEPLQAYLYVPVSEGYQIEAKMRVQVSPASVNKDAFGYMKGEVISAERFPIAQSELAVRLQNDDLARALIMGPPKLQIIVGLDQSPKTPSGYQWSSSDGPPSDLYSGTPCEGWIIVSEERPIHLVFRGW